MPILGFGHLSFDKFQKSFAAILDSKSFKFFRKRNSEQSEALLSAIQQQVVVVPSSEDQLVTFQLVTSQLVIYKVMIMINV